MIKTDEMNKWLTLASIFAPMVLANVKGAEKFAPAIPAVTNAIMEAQQIPGATNEEKKAHVMSITSSFVTAFNAAGKTQLDPVAVAEAASGGVDTTIKVIKAIDATHIPTTRAA